jgi:deoxyribodipyrimidine photo-lyase
MAMMYSTAIVWLRRDLRLDDNAAIAAAARASERIVCAFVLDPILLRGERMGAPIVQFFFDSLTVLREHLRRDGSDLALREGDFAAELATLARHVAAQAVFYNVDYDPAMRERDGRVVAALEAQRLAVHASVDHVYAAAETIVQPSGKPYTVFTPYRKRWEATFAGAPIAPYRSARAARGKVLAAAAIGPVHAVPAPADYGYAASTRFPAGGIDAGERHLRAFIAGGVQTYLETRNAPAVDGTSHLSPHLRAGTVGIRACVDAALRARSAASATTAAASIGGWLTELIWRDFYQGLLVHFPHVADAPFNPAGADVAYRSDARSFAAWCAGETGYPIVDAAMIQLNTTGWMHNRLRMIVASFLTKHLLIDYRLGERYFEQHLADADLGANNGGWQWSSSVGTDAAPYFRVFNPTLQGKTFDPDGTFVRTMLPALAGVPAGYIHEPWAMPPLVAASAGVVLGKDYPAPIVDHAAARTRAIAVYGAALKRR